MATKQRSYAIDEQYLWLGIGSFLFAGLLSVVLVVARSPQINSILGQHDLFRLALAAHVNLSMLVWPSAIVLFLYAHDLTKIDALYHVNRILYYSLVISAIMMFFSPFLPHSIAYINNYVPVIENIFFAISIATVFASLVTSSIFYILLGQRLEHKILAVVAIYSIVVFAFVMERINYAPQDYDIQHYYELVFWGFGHVWQFVLLHLFIYSLYVLLLDLGYRIRGLYSILLINAAAALLSITGVYFYSPLEQGFIDFFTLHMKWCGGIAPSIMVISIIVGVLKRSSRDDIAEYSALYNHIILASLVLFFIGAVIGIFIHAVNVTIPAHYHGTNVGITIALIGLVYYNIIHLFYNSHMPKRLLKLASYQISIYFFGQLLHISGLAWSGGYGVLRKLPGDQINYKAKLAMGVMGFGGLLAIISGVVFAYICYRVLQDYRNASTFHYLGV